MTFLSPALLALGAAVAVPLILHLFQRHQGPRVSFPAVRYLRRAEREHATRIRFRQLFLLALRVLAVVLLAAAAARPFVPGAGDAHEPTAVVVILDNSMSSGAVMDDRRVLDRLKAGARQTLDAAGPDDRFWLIRAGEPWEPALAGDAGEVARAVAAVRPAAGGSNLSAALARAATLLESATAGAREVHLLTDLQARAIESGGAREAAVPVRVLGVPASPANRAVTSLEVGGGISPRAGERSTVSATVDGDPMGDSLAIRLAVDGAVRAAARAPVGSAVVLAFPARPPGLVTGHVEIDRDALAADDRRHFTVDVRPPPAVAVGEALPFLEEAVTVLAEAGRLRRASAADADVVVAPGGRGAERLRTGTHVVVLPPVTALELAAANRRLADAGIPWRLESPAPGEGRIDTTGLALAELLSDVRLRRVYGLTRVAGDAPAPRDSVLIRLRSGEPWAVMGRAGPGAGTYVLLATPLTAEAGTLPVSAAMLPLLDRAVNVWAADAMPGRGYRPGDVIEVPADGLLQRPDGSVEPLPRGARFRLTDAGVYRVRVDDEVVAAFAVNPPPSESDLTALTPAEAAVRIGGDVRLAGPAEWGDVIYHRRLGREVTVPLVLLALAVLFLETAAAAGGRSA